MTTKVSPRSVEDTVSRLKDVPLPGTDVSAYGPQQANEGTFRSTKPFSGLLADPAGLCLCHAPETSGRSRFRVGNPAHAAPESAPASAAPTASAVRPVAGGEFQWHRRADLEVAQPPPWIGGDPELEPARRAGEQIEVAGLHQENCTFGHSPEIRKLGARLPLDPSREGVDAARREPSEFGLLGWLGKLDG